MDADTIMRRLHELEEENKRLKSLLAEHGIPFEVCAHNGDIAASQSSKPTTSSVCLSLQEKVELFQSLFKGREDVFAKRWYSDVTKKSGYQPICEREWNREFCDKRKVPNSPSACLPRLFLSTRNKILRIGVYDSIRYAVIQAVYVLPAPVASTIKARFCPLRILFSNSVTASY